MGKKNNKNHVKIKYTKKDVSGQHSVQEQAVVVKPIPKVTANAQNKASVLRKLIIDAEVITKSPLRIGSGDNDGITDILILKNKAGKYFIPSTSLAGVLRSELESIYSQEVADKLFGSIDDSGNQSMLIVNDTELSNTKLIHRDGVAIDSLTGTAKHGAKYDYEALDRGAKGNIRLELTVRYNDVRNNVLSNEEYQHNKFADRNDCYGELMATIADLLAQGIRIGSLTAKGFGKLAASSTVYCYDYSFYEKQDALKWLDYIKDDSLRGDVIYKGSKAKLLCSKDDFYVSFNCSLRSSLLIADYNLSTGNQEEDYSVLERMEQKNTISAVQMVSGDDFVIPGTSIKGVVRNGAIKILLAINGGNLDKAEAFLNEMMGYSLENTNESKKSKLYVDEVYIKNGMLVPHKQTRNRIDRFSGGTIETALFTVNPVWQQEKDISTIRMTFKVHECSAAEAGLMLLLIKELWDGSLNIGSDKAVGRGVLQGIECKIVYKGRNYTVTESEGAMNATGQKELLESYVQALAGEMND